MRYSELQYPLAASTTRPALSLAADHRIVGGNRGMIQFTASLQQTPAGMSVSWYPSATLEPFRFQWQASSARTSRKAHVTEPMHLDPAANSSTSTRGPWSGQQIIPYWLSDVWKIKHSVAVMTADTVRIH